MTEYVQPLAGRRRVARRWVPLWLLKRALDWGPPLDALFWKRYERRRRPNAATTSVNIRQRRSA